MSMFIPHKLALILKEKGFDEKCIASRLNTKIMYHTDGLRNSQLWLGKMISAPTHQQVIDWLLDEHHINVIPDVSKNVITSSESYYHVLESNIKTSLELI